MAIYGWDASDFDHSRGPMDMRAARADGIDFYTHKATEGTSVKHHPGPSMAAARAAGIPFLGCYLVPRSGPSVAAQVDYFLAWVNLQVPWWREFPGWFWQMDTEHWSYDQVSAQRGHDVAVELAKRTGKRVLHYAPKWAYGDSVPGDEPLWASSYVSGSGHYRSLYPGDRSSKWAAYSGRTPAILQYSSSARIGNQNTCDASAFRGTVADFAALIGAAITTTEGDDVSEHTDKVIDAWRQGNQTAEDGSEVEPVKWRIRDEEWQRSVDAKLATLAAGGVSPAALVDALKTALADPAVRQLLVDAANAAEDS